MDIGTDISRALIEFLDTGVDGQEIRQLCRAAIAKRIREIKVASAQAVVEARSCDLDGQLERVQRCPGTSPQAATGIPRFLRPMAWPRRTGRRRGRGEAAPYGRRRRAGATMTNVYAALSTLKSSGVLNITGTGFDDRLLALLEGVSRQIDGYCNRHFYVLTTSRRFDGGNSRELNVPDLISVTSLKTDEDSDRTYELTWASSDYLLYPLNAEPQQPWGRPYTRILVDLEGGNRSWFPSGGPTVEVTGKWGYRDVSEDSGANINEGAPFSASDTTLTVTDGSKFSAGDTLSIETEALYVTAISTNDLTVTRGVNGTTAAAHIDATDIYLYRYPGTVVEACLMQATRLWKLKDSAYVSGGGERAGKPGGSTGLDFRVERLLAPYRKLSLGPGA